MFGFTGSMTDDTAASGASTRRGSYAKGLAKRAEILHSALEVVAREGYRGASVKEIAVAVGLSQAGLLHYFDSKDELFTEILRTRDEQDASVSEGLSQEVELDALREGFLGVIRHNTRVPGLVHLFSLMAAEAADPAHPAHEYFMGRGEGLRSVLADVLRRAQESGRIDDRVDPETLARMLQALSDGLQLQWMLDPTVDMAATVGALFDLLAVDPPVGPPVDPPVDPPAATASAGPAG